MPQLGDFSCGQRHRRHGLAAPDFDWALLLVRTISVLRAARGYSALTAAAKGQRVGRPAKFFLIQTDDAETYRKCEIENRNGRGKQRLGVGGFEQPFRKETHNVLDSKLALKDSHGGRSSGRVRERLLSRSRRSTGGFGTSRPA